CHSYSSVSCSKQLFHMIVRSSNRAKIDDLWHSDDGTCEIIRSAQLLATFWTLLMRWQHPEKNSASCCATYGELKRWYLPEIVLERYVRTADAATFTMQFPSEPDFSLASKK